MKVLKSINNHNNSVSVRVWEMLSHRHNAYDCANITVECISTPVAFLCFSSNQKLPLSAMPTESKYCIVGWMPDLKYGGFEHLGM